MKKNYKIEVVFDNEQEMVAWIKNQDKTAIQDIPTMRAFDRRKGEGWQSFEDDTIIAEYYKHPTKYIAKSLGRTPSAVSQRILKLKKMGLLSNKTKRNGKVLLNNPYLSTQQV